MALLSSDLAPCELWTIFSESSIIGFEFCMIFWSSTPGFTSIWNGSLFDWYGSLGALDHIFIFYILYIWIPHDFLNKMAIFSSIWNGSLFDRFGSLGALDQFYIFCTLRIWFPHHFLIKMTDFHQYLEWLHLHSFRLSRSSGSNFHLHIQIPHDFLIK